MGTALEYAVALALGATNLRYDTVATWWVTLDGEDRAMSKGWWQSFTPATNWAQGGPIIERESLWVREYAVEHPSVARFMPPSDKWFAYASRRYDGGDYSCYYGETFLIAAMRCFVASKLGDNVYIPKELS